MTKYKFAKVPPRGERIGYTNGVLSVPDTPIVPFVEGDGTGPDIWRARAVVRRRVRRLRRQRRVE